MNYYQPAFFAAEKKKYFLSNLLTSVKGGDSCPPTGQRKIVRPPLKYFLTIQIYLFFKSYHSASLKTLQGRSFAVSSKVGWLFQRAESPSEV